MIEIGMTTRLTTGTGRRALTILAVVASLAIGLLAIRTAAAWTSVAAPLDTSPVAAETLGARLSDESARTIVLEERLGTLTVHAAALQDALAAARARLATDTAHADDLSAQLAAAKAKLAALERSIRDANSASRTTTSTTSTTSTTATLGGVESENGGGDD